MKKLVATAVFVSFLVTDRLGAATMLPAEIFFSQGVSAATQDPTGSAWSDADPGNGGSAYAASAFSVTTSSQLSSITFEGRYTNDGQFNGVDDFSFAIMDSNGSLPSSVLYSDSNAVISNRSVIGQGMSGSYLVDYYSYSIELAIPVLLDAGDYWLALANDTSGANSPNEWTWHFSGSETGYRAYSWTSLVDGYRGPYAADLVFSLSGNVVPEPSSACLLIGACGWGVLRRRSRDRQE